MGAAVVAGGVEAALGLDPRGYGVVASDITFGHDAAMDDEAGHRALGVLHLYATVGASDDAPVAYLSACLCVETSLCEDYFHFLACDGISYGFSVMLDGYNMGFCNGLVVTREQGRHRLEWPII